MKCVSVLSLQNQTEDALAEVLEKASAAIGSSADLALIFASIHHAEGLGKIASELTRAGLGRFVLGCTGESIVGEDREVEEAPALSVWLMSHPGLEAEPYRVTFAEGQFEGPRPDPTSTLLLLGDPFSFPPDQFFQHLDSTAAGVRICGGMASASHTRGRNRLVLQGDVFKDGAVGLQIRGGIGLRTVVSQGCRPIGKPYIVTKVEQNVVRELGRRPALEVFKELFAELTPEEQGLVQSGLHLGRVINEYQESFARGDFLVRNVMGADEQGGIAISDYVRVGQTVQFHVRDSETATEDLRSLLESTRDALGGRTLAGALLFTCNGRGSRLFSRPNHDVGLVHEVFGPIAVGGFFAMGEIGPVGGKNFVHGFTASLALFEEAGEASAG
ncbi:FIST signal transduction protein [Singulisphaera sp. PoT]|uniref:FIST signal transduction protein n=1 Tax=Singulisphaera sp. PoT TaxID=3411797 RepID=UPI003BF510C7